MVQGNFQTAGRVIVSIEEKSGFCGGVRRTIRLAEEILDRGEKLYCLGQVVHNEEEVERLRQKGLIFIDQAEFEELKNARVLIRAHGEPPETYLIAEQNGIDLVEGTCPIVRKIQDTLRKEYRQPGFTGSIVIYGKIDHPEVIGLNGQLNYEALVVKSAADLGGLELKTPVRLYSQTTMDIQGFLEVAEKLEGLVGLENIEVNDTICRHIAHREPGLKVFAASNDVVLFVSGKKSSNGRILYTACKAVNPNTYFISGIDEIDPEWFENAGKTGICGATSTPEWLLEKVAEHVRSFTKN